MMESRAAWILLFLAFPATMQAQPPPDPEPGPPPEAIARIEAPPEPIARPATDALCALIRESASLMAKETQSRAARWIGDMDEAHLKCVRDARILVQPHRDARAWVLQKTDTWPAITPLCERTILAALSTQIDMLDAVLWKKNEAASKQLRRDRCMVRVRNDDERFFHDGRDNFIGAVLTAVSQISALQEALGSPGKVAGDFPRDVKALSEVEEHLLAKMRRIAEKAQRIGK